ncbi:MAG: hypothetical protein M1491_01175, partial [Deltaproteobacteria bacterium]|nr:hypothetical protein [Deltaproteobacteria bacterium]
MERRGATEPGPELLWGPLASFLCGGARTGLFWALIPKVIMGLIEQKERVFDTAKGNTSGLPAM